jgi:sulfhydrogenase subunit delta
MKPRVGIFGLSGCWGEQIVILNCEDELLSLVGAIDLVDFLGGSSANDREGPLDVALVEGSVAGPRQQEALRRIRARATHLVACGSCACFGGVSAMEAPATREQMAAAVYGPMAARYELSPHEPLGAVVQVDAAIPGCPIEKKDLLQAIASLLNGDRPALPDYPVCAECKMQEQDCLLLSRGIPCAGPVTAAGCGARCPGYEVPCIGCRGPVDEANFQAMAAILAARGLSAQDIAFRLRTFAPTAAGQPPRPAVNDREPARHAGPAGAHR